MNLFKYNNIKERWELTRKLIEKHLFLIYILFLRVEII